MDQWKPELVGRLGWICPQTGKQEVMDSRGRGLGPMGSRLGWGRRPMVAGRAAGRRGPGQRSSLVGSCGAESSGWCAERFSVPRAVRPSRLLKRPGPVRACVSAPAPGAVARGGEPPPQVRGRRGGKGGIEGASRNGSEGPESSQADSG